MRYTLASLALAATAAAVANPVAIPAPQGVTSAVAPSSSAPSGCSSSYSGKFEIEIVNVTTHSKRSLDDTKQLNVLTVSLSNGVLTDSDGRTGYIAANSQFQFDKPAQTGAIYTAGWSVCGNGSLAIGGTAVFQGCLSGTFYNLYLHNDAAQCSPIYIVATGGSGSVNTIGDGQPTGSAVNPICQQTDGQPAITGCASAAVSQMSDGQVLATSAASASAAVSQISDGQIQATTAVAPPYTTSRAVASTGVKPTPVASGSGIPVAQISDGQVQATTAKATVTTPPSASSAAAYTGAAMPTAAAAGVELFGLAAGVLAVAML